MNKLKSLISNITPLNIVFAILFAIAFTVSRHLMAYGLYDSASQIIVTTPWYTDVFAFVGSGFVFLGVQMILAMYSNTMVHKHLNRWFWIPFIVIWLYYLFYALTNYPGSILSDSRSSLYQILLAPDIGLSNHHPLLFTALTNVFVMIGQYVQHDVSKGVFLYTLFQVSVIALILAYSIYWLARRHVSSVILALVCALYTFFPYFPMFAIAMWKDPVFGAVSLLLVLWIVDYFSYRQDNNWKYVSRLCATMFVLMAYRNNGVYVILAFLVYLFIFHFHGLKHLKTMMCCIVCVYFAISGPLYNVLNVEKPSVEFIGIPVQQIGYVLNEKPEVLNQKEFDVLNEIMPIERWAKQYAPRIVDNIKWNDAWSDEAKNAHFMDFLKVWFNHIDDCFAEYVTAYLMATQGFWDPVKSMMHEYYYTGVVDNDLGIVSRNLLSEHGINVLPPTLYLRSQIGSGTLLWLMVAALGVIWIKKRKECIPAFGFIICTWLTVMVATPLTFGMRYVTPLIYALPVLMVLPYTANEEYVVEPVHPLNKSFWPKQVLSTLAVPVIYLGLLGLLVVTRPIFILESYTDDQLFYPLSSDTVYQQSLSFEDDVTINRIHPLTQWDGKTNFSINFVITDQQGNNVFERIYDSSVLSDDPLNPWSRFYLDNLQLEAGEYILTIQGNDDSYLNGLTIGHQYSWIVSEPVQINGSTNEYHMNMKVIGYQS